MKIRCWIDRKDGFWSRDVEFPFTPFIGMVVGAEMVVVQVLVCQGDLDGKGEVEVRLESDAEFDEFLPLHGWRREIHDE
jgi:hypothetical protein